MTIDFPLTARRDARAARRFFKESVKLHDTPERVYIDKSGANKAGLKLLNEEHQYWVSDMNISEFNPT